MQLYWLDPLEPVLRVFSSEVPQAVIHADVETTFVKLMRLHREGERTRIRALLDTGPEHKPLLWGKQMKTLAPNGCRWNPSYLPSQHFPPGPDWASFFFIPLSLRLFFCLLHFHPTQVDLNVDNKPFLFPPMSEFRKQKNKKKRQHKCLEKKRQTVNVKCC